MPVTPLPEPVRRVSAYLAAAGAEARVEQLPADCAGLLDAAAALGCAPAQLVTTAVLVCDRAAVVALVPGDREPDPGRVARLVGASAGRMAGAEEVVRVTGFEPGAVAPFPLLAAHHVLAERSLLGHRVVWVGAGSARHLVALAPRELLRLSRARSVAIGR